ncbi:MAG: hypothetical protein JSW07_02500 [bacterium]|nr:MAG: hypothetical protein JSW07_02500 [bacterium]
MKLHNYTNVWKNKTLEHKPTGRIDLAMASVCGTEKIIIFGGWNNGTNLNDTWVYDYNENTWTEKYPSIKPSARWGIKMGSIYGTEKFLLFGGNDGSNCNDTWIYDLNQNEWTEKFPFESPKPRNFYGMTSVWGTDKVVLFSGMGPGLNDTWIYDFKNNTWKEKTILNPPSVRRGHSMTSIWGTDKILMFGGFDGSNFLEDTWIFDLSDEKWTEINPTLEPDARSPYSLSYFHGTDKILLYGGTDGTTFDDTWIFNFANLSWMKINTPVKPPKSYFHGTASIQGKEAVIFFGGYHGNPSIFKNCYNFTWIFYLNSYKNGTFISEPHDAGLNFTFKNLSWTAETPVNTSIKLQLKSAVIEDELNTKEFIGPDGTSSTYYSTSPTPIWSGHNGDRWIQYKVYMNNTDITITPSFKNVTITYNYLPETTLIAPNNGTITASNKPIFLWNFNDTDSVQQSAFQVLIDNNSNFQSIDFDSEEQNSADKYWQFPNGTDYLEIPDGTWYWKVRTKDSDGDWGSYSSARKLIIDTNNPVSTITFPENEKFYNNLDMMYGTVYDIKGGTGVKKVEISIKCMNDDNYWSGTDWSSDEYWLTTVDTTNWSYDLSSIKWTSGTQYLVRSQAVDNATNIEIPGSGIVFTLDFDVPYSTIDNLDNNSYVKFIDHIFGSAGDVVNGSGVKSVEIGLKHIENNSYWTGASWISGEAWLKANRINPWTLSVNNVNWISDNNYIFYSRAVDIAGNIEPLGPGISFMYDDRPPENLSILINSDAVYTNLSNVTLNLEASDSGSGVYQMRFDTGDLKWTEWEDFNNSKAISLAGNDGEKKIYFFVNDKAGNVATHVSDSIILDTKPPSELSISINGGAEKTDSTTVTLSISANDITSGLYQMSFSTDGSTWSDWENFSKSKNFTFPEGDGKKTIYFKVRDSAGNEAEPVSASITLDTTTPTDGPDGDSESKESEDKKTKMSTILIGLIIVIIIVIIVLVLFLKKRKKVEEAKEVPIQVPQEEPVVMPTPVEQEPAVVPTPAPVEQPEQLPAEPQPEPIPQPMEEPPQVSPAPEQAQIPPPAQLISAPIPMPTPTPVPPPALGPAPDQLPVSIEPVQAEPIPTPQVTEEQPQADAPVEEPPSPTEQSVPAPVEPTVTEDIPEKPSHKPTETIQEIGEKESEEGTSAKKTTEENKEN